MELHYRGAVYNTNAASIEMVNGEMMGRYRGALLQFQQPRVVPARPTRFPLKYRGIEIQ